MGKHCSGVFFWIYAIFTVLLIFHSASAVYEYHEHGESERFYSSVAMSILLAIVLALACIHSKLTYIILIVVFGIIVLIHFVAIVFYCLGLASIAANNENRQQMDKETVTGAIIVLCVQILFLFFKFSLFKLFYTAYKYEL